MIKKKFIALLMFFYSIPFYTQEFQNYTVLNEFYSHEEIQFIEDKLSGFDFFVIGEEHYAKGNIEVQLMLFKYLHNNKNVNHLLIEQGNSLAILLNLYLKTGDEKIFDRIWFMKMDIVFFSKLKAYYDSLPKNRKFIIHGVDYEKKGIEFVEIAILKIVEYLIQNKAVLSEHTLDYIKNKEFKYGNLGSDYYKHDAIQEIFSFLSEIEKNPNLHKEEFGEYYEDLLALYRALKVDVKGVKYKENTFHPLREDREKLIYNQIIELKKLYPNDRFFCVFGTAHIPLKAHEDWVKFIRFESFITKLNTYADSPFNSKILSILPLYKSCIPRWKKSYVKKHIGLNKTQMNELDEKSKGNLFTLFEYPNETEEQKKFRKEYYQMILINRY
ncbi:MAG: hypothetical protein CVT95_11005 [Bacteroidetes bacterium HGW-Bacteroidetes-12]|nr:MAG: hypothetical protein CVT95_11005 [Bacteroidetes bacterium HGW-Bacteroidetes-12]